MEKSFKQSMRWLHTFSGLILGWLLFAIFVTGTSAYYKDEINLWMQPELHYSKASSKTMQIAKDKALQFSQKVPNVSVFLPSDRKNTITLMYGQKVVNSRRFQRFTHNYDASLGEEIDSRRTAGGNFLYRFHFQLYGFDHHLARWLVIIATMSMFIAIITGIIIHTRIFKDIFVFREKKGIRSWMDVHILPSIAALPFMIMITYSGLLFFSNLVMPWGLEAVYKNKPQNEFRKDFNELRSGENINSNIKRVRLTNQNRTISKENLDLILKKASKKWTNNISAFSISKSRNGFVNVMVLPKNKSSIFDIRSQREYLLYDGVSTNLIKHNKPTTSNSLVMNINSSFRTLHIATFANSSLRFLFFISGLAGVIIIASGLILWTVKRKKKYEDKKHFGFVLVEKLNLGTIVGIFIALASYFLANRFIELENTSRHILEINTFFAVWALCFVYAIFRNTKKAWFEKMCLASFLFLLLVILEIFYFSESISEYLLKDSILHYFDMALFSFSLFFALAAFIFIKKDKKESN